ncbi:putative lipoprotein [Pseudomonas savastanoi pv. glycinea str. race 4]|nr:putative lipoprotein [Pseudomonas savastanoi pv. glycinea str. race 4]
MFAMTSDLEMHGRYPTAYRQGMQRRLDDRWLVEYQSANAYTIRLKDGLSYRVTPLNDESMP